MRAIFEKVELDSSSSFHVEERSLPRFDAPWHFHPEFELTLIVASRGRRFVGDSIEPFRTGDMVLLGPELPHLWANDPGYGRAHSIVLQFLPGFAGSGFMDVPEMREIAGLLARAGRGLQFHGPRPLKAAEALRQLPSTRGFERFAKVLDILEMLSAAQGARPLSSLAFRPALDSRAGERINRAYRFVFAHFREEIGLPEVATAAGMSTAAFSRYFKKVTGRNVIAFLTRTRVDHAARLLLDTDLTVSEIAYACGFNNLSNFNRRFRQARGMPPGDFRKQKPGSI